MIIDLHQTKYIIDEYEILIFDGDLLILSL
jgi:hypothetical protein